MTHSVPYWRNQPHTLHGRRRQGAGEEVSAWGMIEGFVVTAEGTEVPPRPADPASKQAGSDDGGDERATDRS